MAITASFPKRASGADQARARMGLASKRVIDVAGALLLLLLLAPLILLVAIAVRLDSDGPALFRQRRVGRFGEEFSMLKFRSMKANASPDLHRRYISQLAGSTATPMNGELVKLTGDPRVTRLGGILRRTSLDELPQLLNVVTGRMSLVGPRPAVPYELQHYRLEHFARFAVRPGLTGLWQVSGRARLGPDAMLDLDVDYVRRRTLLLDLELLLRTPKAVLSALTA